MKNLKKKNKRTKANVIADSSHFNLEYLLEIEMDLKGKDSILCSISRWKSRDGRPYVLASLFE